MAAVIHFVNRKVNLILPSTAPGVLVPNKYLSKKEIPDYTGRRTIHGYIQFYSGKVIAAVSFLLKLKSISFSFSLLS